MDDDIVWFSYYFGGKWLNHQLHKLDHEAKVRNPTSAGE